MADDPAPAPPPAAPAPAAPAGFIETKSPLEAARDANEGIVDPPRMDPAGLEAARAKDIAAAQAKKAQEPYKKAEAGAYPDPDGPPPPDPAGDPQADPEPPEPKEGPDLDWKPKGDKPAQNWKMLKAALSERSQQVKALQTKLDQGQVPADVTEMQKELAELKDVVRKSALEKDPEFNKKFDVRRKVVLDSAISAAGGKSSEMAALMEQPASAYRDDRIKELTEDMPDHSKRRIDAALTMLESIHMQRSTEIASSAAEWDAHQARAGARQTEEARAADAKVRAMFDEVSDQWKGEDGHFLYQADKDDPEMVNRQLTVAREILEGSMDAEDQVKSALIIAGYNRMTTGYQTLIAERNSLRTQLRKIQGVQPAAGSESGLIDPAKPAPIKHGDAGYDQSFAVGLEQARQADLGT